MNGGDSRLGRSARLEKILRLAAPALPMPQDPGHQGVEALAPAVLQEDRRRRPHDQLLNLVGVAVGVMDNRRYDGPVRRPITPQLISDQSPRLAPLAFQSLTKKAFNRMLIAAWLEENIYCVSVLVDGEPEILPLTLDSHE